MDLLELEPDECEADFLQEDVDDDVETAPLPPPANNDNEDLLDQVFGDCDIGRSAPSFGDELSFDPLSSTLQPTKDAVATSTDPVDEGFDPFEDSEATIGSVESFGDGPQTRDLRDRPKDKDRQNRKSGECETFRYRVACTRLKIIEVTLSVSPSVTHLVFVCF